MANLKSEIWIFQRSNALKNCKETNTLLYEITYKIVRHIIMVNPSLSFSLSCIFPLGNRIVTGLVLSNSHELLHVQRFELDPEVPQKALLTATSKNDT
jgi:hypothetical protein